MTPPVPGDATVSTAPEPALRRLRSRLRRLVQRPGTVELGPWRDLLPAIAGREASVRRLDDAQLADAAVGPARDLVGFCAVAREAARRALGQRPFDVQVLGTLAMLRGHVVEMATGEGKTLAGALAAAGHALDGHDVQVWSVNDYLARRDAEWMRPLYDLLGVSVGWVDQSSSREERRAAYGAQVTYVAVGEAGFDVLRDRLCTDARERVGGTPDTLLIDEADSVLVDEAMVPLVLAGTAPGDDRDRDMPALVRGLRAGRDYEVGDEGRTVHLTEIGAREAERALGGIDLYTAEHASTLSRLNVALHAHVLLRRDVDYLVSDDRIHLVDESRGRVARLQRWPDGLHAAVEAKEGITASEGGEILDSLTVQSLVGRFVRVCGMTGTAVAVREELREFYGLEVAVIPPNRRCVRLDEPALLFATREQKEQAVVERVAACHAVGRPVLLGTLDVAESEHLAGRLEARGLPCQVLNARNDALEAGVIAEAGALGAVTVSTQMAGRGTDIRLGGSGGDPAPVVAVGGLQVIGTGRHPSSRLDRQLRGRAGRQGDPGGSVVFSSVEDALAVRYAPDTPWPDADGADGRITHAGALAAVEHAQRVAEGVRRETHRTTWRYHRMLQDQRDLVLEHRERVLRGDAAVEVLAVRCAGRVREVEARVGRWALVLAARQVTLWHLDREWTEHLARVADLREGIHLRALGRGMDPLAEFQRELIVLFADFPDRVVERAAVTFATVGIGPAGADLDAAGLRRPTATWTYLVQDNPFGSDVDRALRGIGRALRGGRR